ncbi:hypothetical protein EVAR_54562_1 [Eumeta japonica]|uniref:Uncharacterized protein n=1 Tax=Eumeta variegata TaxID=151549 RepID=A0A4C1YHT6_EUMVA|nr:hypothetical protein EVAR_54562_1 [Eumeta japonica]
MLSTTAHAHATALRHRLLLGACAFVSPTYPLQLQGSQPAILFAAIRYGNHKEAMPHTGMDKKGEETTSGIAVSRRKTLLDNSGRDRITMNPFFPTYRGGRRTPGRPGSSASLVLVQEGVAIGFNTIVFEGVIIINRKKEECFSVYLSSGPRVGRKTPRASTRVVALLREVFQKRSPGTSSPWRGELNGTSIDRIRRLRPLSRALPAGPVRRGSCTYTDRAASKLRMEGAVEVNRVTTRSVFTGTGHIRDTFPSTVEKEKYRRCGRQGVARRINDK